MKKCAGCLIGLSLITCFITAFSCHLLADQFGHDEFFSYGRFFKAMQILDVSSRRPGIRQDVRDFAVSFNEGVYALSNGNYASALRRFYSARSKWPEYYGTDFLMALTYEKSGDIRKAARFYKGYLNKLRTFEAGHFPISSTMIAALNTEKIDNYNYSKPIIEAHLKSYGIDLNDVRPPVAIAGFLKSSLLIFGILTIFLTGYYLVWPHIMRQNRINNPSPGFWTCKNCLEENPDPVKECKKCRKLREA